MTRLTRIICDNPDCPAQVEQFAGEYFRRYQGMDDTPEGWYRLAYHAPKIGDATNEPDYPDEPMFFCSIACVRSFAGVKKVPAQVIKRCED